jgi:hypothetical protein
MSRGFSFLPTEIEQRIMRPFMDKMRDYLFEMLEFYVRLVSLCSSIYIPN